MKNKLPTPVCTSFLTCRGIAVDQRTGDDILVGLPRALWSRIYPSAAPISLFIRCTSGHGNYPVEVQFQNVASEIVWKDGPSEPWVMLDPLEMYDLKMNVCVAFPAPGIYQFVLVLDGEEVTRQRFHAKLGDVPASPQSDPQNRS